MSSEEKDDPMEEKDDPMIDDILSSIKSIVNETNEEEAVTEVAAEPETLLDDDFESLMQPAPEPTPVSTPAPVADIPLDLDDMEESIISAATASEGAQQFIKLNNMIRMGNSNVTLSDIVRSLLRPMLREWLDENLPLMVERMVEYEIKRLVSRIDQNDK